MTVDRSLEAGNVVPALRQVPRIHIVGKKNAGKTTLVCDLVKELSQRGFQVATIKHTHHHHELDTPGKDSHKHRESGAAGVGILSSEMTAAFVPVARSESEAIRYARFNIMFNDCDIILVEGDLASTAIKMEVWRSAAKEAPYAATDPSITCVVTDEICSTGCDTVLRSSIADIANYVLAKANLRPQPEN
ncbi:MAG: molybdopterin-guanine dinucleotide biosynthesis protein B [Fuerstiella sp.]|jgi:molybdopterin-guanine dinucleotide biosynthesis adapter protein